MFTIKVFTFSPIEENTYLLFNAEKECIIIDPGSYFDEDKQQLATFIEENALTPKFLLNTHCHLDHVFSNKFVAENYKLTLHLHKDEEKMLERAPASGLMFNLPFDNYEGEFIFLEEGDIITLGDDVLNVILAPGHSPGSICFYCKDQKFLIGGDVLFYQNIGRSDLPGGDHNTLLKSIREKILILPDDVVVYSGHGRSTTVGEEKLNNPYVGINT